MTRDPLDPSLVAALAVPDAYPDDPSAKPGVEHVQTHLSHVFLTRDRVYKLRKAVRLGFVDFSSRRRRNADCVREVVLNRRLARDVYLGVASVAGGHVGPVRDCPKPDGEHVVVMRRLPQGRDALSLLERGRLTCTRLDAAADRIASFHATHSLGRPAPFSPEEWREAVAAPVRANHAVLGDPRVERLAEEFLAEHAADFEVRRQEGRAVDGHGDLHLQHLWFDTDDTLRIIDCIEFDDGLRRIDAASDVAFLVMDLAYRGHAGLGERLLARYARQTDDYGLYRVVDYFISYRAAVRAKVAAIAADDPAIDRAQRERAEASVAAHVDLAVRALEPRERGAVVAFCGAAGTGKSSVAEVVAEACSGVVVATDVVRKRLAGLPEDAHTPAAWGRGAYTSEARLSVYEAALERAAAIVASGRTVVLDAAFGERALRDRLASWARERGIEPWLVETACERDVVRARLARRAALGTDPSDVGPELVDASADRFEPPVEWPASRLARVDTGSEDWIRAARTIGRRVR